MQSIAVFKEVTILTATVLQHCGLAARVKTYLLSSEGPAPRHGGRGSGRGKLAATKMLPISEDEFVVTFRD